MSNRMLPVDMQRANEFSFARAHIDGYIRKFLDGEADIQEAKQKAVALLEEYRWKTYSYTSKNLRMEMVRDLDLEPIIDELFVASCYCQIPELFSSFTAKLAGMLGFDDKQESITTIAEMTAIVCDTDVYDVSQEGRYGSWKISSNVELPEKLMHMVERSTYLPPVVCFPRILTENFQQIRETCKPESMILNNNHHSGDICLDVLNIVNGVELCLNLEFLSTVEEEPNNPFENRDQQDSWMVFKKQSHEMYKLMAAQGNRFHLLHKYDKRGRIYAQGYHISTQGSPYKKASIDLFNKEKVIGVPKHLQIISK